VKIVILDGVALNPGDLSWAGLEKHGEVFVYEFTHPHEVMERIEGAEAVFTNKTRLTAETIRSAESLRFIGVMATGFDVVDIDAARKRRIPVCNAPNYSTPAVAQLAMAFLLEHEETRGVHNVCASSDDTMRGLSEALGWALHKPVWLPMPEVSLRLTMGEVADELILTGQRVSSRKLFDAGFRYRYPTLDKAVLEVVSEKRAN
jgi:lactate dehydrogenase-like 2-hydroxyacid dehydrogenase